MEGIDLVAAKRSLLGTAIGDSLGLPYEGLSASRAPRILKGALRQRMLFGCGFLSDDTLQSALVFQSLLQHATDAGSFQLHFARKLRLWFASLPPGIGLSTAKACLKLSLGVSPSKSGVRSAGNGAAMRSAVIGAAFCQDPDRRVRYVEACARVTHTDQRAVDGAQLVALAASLAVMGKLDEFESLAAQLVRHWNFEVPWPERGPSGYVLHTVNASLSIVRSSADIATALERCILLGGDTDTTTAIVGGILGPNADSVPKDWLRWHGWPQPGDIEDMEFGSVSYPRLLGQHSLALPVILVYGFRRMLPPY